MRRSIQELISSHLSILLALYRLHNLKWMRNSGAGACACADSSSLNPRFGACMWLCTDTNMTFVWLRVCFNCVLSIMQAPLSHVSLQLQIQPLFMQLLKMRTTWFKSLATIIWPLEKKTQKKPKQDGA